MSACCRHRWSCPLILSACFEQKTEREERGELESTFKAKSPALPLLGCARPRPWIELHAGNRSGGKRAMPEVPTFNQILGAVIVVAGLVVI